MTLIGKEFPHVHHLFFVNAGEQEIRGKAFQSISDPHTVTGWQVRRLGAMLRSGSFQFAVSVIFVSSFV